MNLCSEGHDEVCYEGRYCPVCSEKNDTHYYEEELDKAQKRIEELEILLREKS